MMLLVPIPHVMPLYVVLTKELQATYVLHALLVQRTLLETMPLVLIPHVMPPYVMLMKEYKAMHV
jgi:hypothetical protein